MEQVYNSSRTAYDRSDCQIQKIEQTYGQITAILEYIFKAAQADTVASYEWLQMELVHTANAAEKFTSDVWSAIIQQDAKKANKEANWDTYVL